MGGMLNFRLIEVTEINIITRAKNSRISLNFKLIAGVHVNVKVEYFTILRNITGLTAEDLEVPGESTIQDVLDTIVEKYGETLDRILRSGKEYVGLKVLFRINGQNAESLYGLQTALTEGAVLSIIPPLSGG